MTKKLLTVVIPTYNMEVYLSRCLDSLLINNELLDKIEVLIINDGSQDRSSEIAHEYEKCYPDTFRVIDKENGNYGSCVNRSLIDATGKYFKLLDADDWFLTESFERFIGYLEDCETDVVLTSYSQRFPNKSLHFNFQELTDGQRYLVDDIGPLKNSFCMHALTFRLDLLRKVCLHHQEGISYTDIEYCYFPLTKASDLTYFDLNLYQYYIGRDGQTISNISFIKNKKDLIKVTNRVLHDFVSIKGMPESRKNILSDIILFPLYRLYQINLIYDKIEDSFIELESLVMTNEEILQKTSKCTYRKVPFVSIWRRFGINCALLRFI